MTTTESITTLTVDEAIDAVRRLTQESIDARIAAQDSRRIAEQARDAAMKTAERLEVAKRDLIRAVTGQEQNDVLWTLWSDGA